MTSWCGGEEGGGLGGEEAAVDAFAEGDDDGGAAVEACLVVLSLSVGSRAKDLVGGRGSSDVVSVRGLTSIDTDRCRLRVTVILAR
ncbi:hypothetical protein PHSY_002223 [Pseudozyma hubeiensis SY62]|uniref:Uncharacterized protein n=1 Tax=Pseudozyma hubeiensis (strain SY62) TaxID=1305764 RepID=R9P974_PSEHS|nr:hypothetical protein PHSY_002223 [Pseudozyma hubeiensis SY62]GAC94650.1 hypothetical protein PHSY_002223 [Pseudozyma hubeiensis SY62]